MGTRLFLLCAGRTVDGRTPRFPADAPLGDRDAARIQRVAVRLPRFDRIVCSPASAARAVADLIGAAGEVVADLRGQDFGRWSGRVLDDVARQTPDAVARWLREPDFAPPDGESFEAVMRRTRAWLDRERTQENRRTLAVTHVEVIRAAILCVLGAPAGAAGAIDVEPLTITELTCDGRRWALRRVGVRPADAADERA